ncbi:hypothetical protein ACQCU1_02760 [Sutcliffiella horikoshii]|uniref:hypothetical protein n=1 Tax=Sutcliffiella horikoshii TaxID=79883 RepID=UPI003CEBED23
MTSNIESIRNDLKKAYDIRESVLTIMREFHIDNYHKERAAINGNSMLSDEGKSHKLSKLRDKTEVETMQALYDMDRTYKQAVISAGISAERELSKPLPKVDEFKQQFFDYNMQEVKANVQFALTTKTAVEALQKLSDVNDRALAKQAAVNVLALSKEILANATNEERLQVNKQLNSLYTKLMSKAQSEHAAEAKRVVEETKRLLQFSLVSPILVNALGEISKDLGSYANKPSEYMAVKGDFIKKVNTTF